MAVTGTYDLVGRTMCAAMQHVCYATEGEAERLRQRMEDRTGNRSLKVFRCDECGQFHFGREKAKAGAA